jgi:uncharacterized protein (TIGR03905 family)
MEEQMKNYKTTGVCSSQIDFKVEDGIVKNVTFHGGCEGNLQGVSQLVEGLTVKQVIAKLDGITCGRKSTSCPDQLAKALLSIS